MDASPRASPARSRRDCDRSTYPVGFIPRCSRLCLRPGPSLRTSTFRNGRRSSSSWLPPVREGSGRRGGGEVQAQGSLPAAPPSAAASTARPRRPWTKVRARRQAGPLRRGLSAAVQACAWARAGDLPLSPAWVRMGARGSALSSAGHAAAAAARPSRAKVPAPRRRQGARSLAQDRRCPRPLRGPQHDGAIDQLGYQPIPALQIERAAQASRQGKPSVIVEFESRQGFRPEKC